MVIKESPDLNLHEKLKVKDYLHEYGKNCNNSLPINWRPYGNYEDNLDDILEHTKWVFMPKHELSKVDESLKKLILVEQYECDVGLTCMADFVYQGDAIINERDLYGVLKKLSNESHYMSFMFFCETQYMDKFSGMLLKLLGQEHLELRQKAVYVEQKRI